MHPYLTIALALTLGACTTSGSVGVEDPIEVRDFDGDGIPDDIDTDDDNDGIPDDLDDDPYSPTDTGTGTTDTGTTDTGTTDTGTGTTDPLDVDDDLDGLTENEGDCDDADATVYLGAPEVCDGVDNDCDPATDIDVGTECYDDDNDGFTEDEGDCNDGQPAMNPFATDLVGDGVDQNCDGTDGTDLDGDGFASELSGGSDCDDTDNFVFLGAVEVWYDGIPQDCANVGNPNWPGDGDQDGDGDDADFVGGGDCDDTDPAIFTGQLEDNSNGIDDNCNGVFDSFRATALWDPNTDPTLTFEITDLNDSDVYAGEVEVYLFGAGGAIESFFLIYDPSTHSAYGELNRDETALEAEYPTLGYSVLLVNGYLFGYCWGTNLDPDVATVCNPVDLTAL